MSELFDQPLTIDVTLPESWSGNAAVTNEDSQEIGVRQFTTADGDVLRFDVPPTDARYTLSSGRRSSTAMNSTFGRSSALTAANETNSNGKAIR